ncbi:hypothetical protein Tco_0953267 [Tanacetum coccineum]|uniref:Uncharacterized protein n=1 Tax=Tanacetum coccineum TaxID=301880 RepID=A0ABQ5E1P0_9ASTR
MLQGDQGPIMFGLLTFDYLTDSMKKFHSVRSESQANTSCRVNKKSNQNTDTYDKLSVLGSEKEDEKVIKTAFRRVVQEQVYVWDDLSKTFNCIEKGMPMRKAEALYEESLNKTLRTCLLGRTVAKSSSINTDLQNALEDDGWVDAMQEELFSRILSSLEVYKVVKDLLWLTSSSQSHVYVWDDILLRSTKNVQDVLELPRVAVIVDWPRFSDRSRLPRDGEIGLQVGVIMELYEGECCWPATRGVVEEDEGHDEKGDGEGGNERAGGSHMSTRDNLEPHLQIDPFPGFEADYPPYGYHGHMPPGYTYRPDPSHDGSS